MSNFSGWIRISGKLTPTQKKEFLNEMKECAKISEGHYEHKFTEGTIIRTLQDLIEPKKDTIMWDISGDYYIFDGDPRDVEDELEEFLEILKKYKLKGNGECEYLNTEDMDTEVGNVTIKNNKIVEHKTLSYGG